MSPQAPWPTAPAAPVRTFLWPASRAKAAILLAHGFGEYSARYHRLIGAVNEAGYSVYAYDHRGHGESLGPRAVVNVRELVRDHLAARTALLGLQLPLFAFGHSMGGLITAASYLQDPRGVKGVVLSSPALLVGVNEPIWRKQVGRVLARVVPHLKLFELTSGGLSRLPEVEDAYRKDPQMNHGKIAVLTGVSTLQLSESIWDTVAKWTLPTLVLHGDQDKLADVEGSRHFAGAISSTDKTYREVAGGYHELFNDTERDDTTRELLHWLDARV